jgi:hypothetical protein
MPGLRTRSAGAKVTDEEYGEIEKRAEARGLTVGEWCREVILAEVERAEGPSPENVMAEVMAVRLLLPNMVGKLLQGERMTAEEIQKLIEKVDGTKFRRVTEVVAAHAATKNPQPEEVSGNGKG